MAAFRTVLLYTLTKQFSFGQSIEDLSSPKKNISEIHIVKELNVSLVSQIIINIEKQGENWVWELMIANVLYDSKNVEFYKGSQSVRQSIGICNPFLNRPKVLGLLCFNYSFIISRTIYYLRDDVWCLLKLCIYFCCKEKCKEKYKTILNIYWL